MPPAPTIAIDFEGRAVPAVPGEPVALALWRAGERILARSVKYHRPRGIQCMQEHCASCLVRIDGIPNQFACTAPCSDGLTVSRQNAFPSASADLFRAIDWAFPKTFNHHEMLAGIPVASQVMAKVARKLAGLGELPGEPGKPFSEPGKPFGAGAGLGGCRGRPARAHPAGRAGANRSRAPRPPRTG